ncbi:bifunctional adenosylcobinamide kinase/adenosylcobinamide-phosphate guanylyltransferase [Streptomyces hoynatensis]|uniref:Adenosylcobinamide kinase n=1 Tax=Streptomyces hoynatensis TaxID=1141874 RepID=A0A3A9Z1G0_9ACTN|nr:bifunctional adenosylcobinamide kinase/adenosylcobinamide-phosphate guanylyltransferase [Streptomyces hoynatensis]RKN42241.1 bifunctional adenosylcobinamide kinase/adenosylcobinamide-phosphate guanylyltransferase [Streptomyces hoynatensis]
MLERSEGPTGPEGPAGPEGSVVLLGTGGDGGLPREGCPCAACAAALGGRARGATSVLVDGTLLLEAPPGVWGAAARAGRSLTGVRTLLTSRAAGAGRVPGLPDARALAAGAEEVLPGGHRVRAAALDRPAGEVGYEVTSPGGRRLLYLPPGAALAAPGGQPCDLVLLDVLGRPDALAALRAAGTVTPATDVVAVHLGHEAPPWPEAGRRLAAAGARALPDGAEPGAAAQGRGVPVPRRTLVLGGARSGKSAEAERRLAAFPGVHYVATAGRRPGDAEWAARVARHRARRPAHWTTAETCDLVPLLTAEGPPLLVDCLSLWLTDAMDAVGAWDDPAWEDPHAPPGPHDPPGPDDAGPAGPAGPGTAGAGAGAGGGRGGARAALAERTAALVAAFRGARRTVVAVSNEVGSGVVPATPAGRRFRDELGRLNAAVAAECDCVLLVTAGLAQRLR